MNVEATVEGDTLSLFPSDGLSVDLGGAELRHRYDFKAVETRIVSGDGGGGKNAVVTPMPGTVVKMQVSEGDEVEKGQPLLILEAMKMEHVIKVRFLLFSSLQFLSRRNAMQYKYIGQLMRRIALHCIALHSFIHSFYETIEGAWSSGREVCPVWRGCIRR